MLQDKTSQEKEKKTEEEPKITRKSIVEISEIESHPNTGGSRKLSFENQEIENLQNNKVK